MSCVPLLATLDSPTLALWLAGGMLSLAVLFLVAGGNMVVKAASSMALRLGATEIAIAATVVAIGTSLPELFVSAVAALQKHPDIALGNVFGSNIANVGLVLGLTALIKPVEVKSPVTRVLLSFYMLLLLALFAWLLVTQYVGWMAGGVMLSLLVAMIFWLYRGGPDEVSTQEDPSPIARPLRWLLFLLFGEVRGSKLWATLNPSEHLWSAILYLFLGIAFLVLGGNGFVQSATTFANFFGVSEFVIALGVVAVGTSLPEVAVSVSAAAKGRGDMSLGNIVGSNIFNILLVIGFSSLLLTFKIDIWDRTTLVTFGVMFFMGALVWFPVFVLKRRFLSRTYGAILLVIYFLTMWFWFK